MLYFQAFFTNEKNNKNKTNKETTERTNEKIHKVDSRSINFKTIRSSLYTVICKNLRVRAKGRKPNDI